MLDLLGRIVSEMPSEPGMPARPGRGLLQGSPLSPLFCNLALHRFDSAMEEQGIRFVRFADDIAAVARSEPEARGILERIEDALRPLDLSLAREKCSLCPASEAEFLGYSFRREAGGAWAPAVSGDTAARVVDRSEQWCRDQPAQRNKDLAATATRVGQLYSEWFSHYRTTGDSAGLAACAASLRDMLRREALRRIPNTEARASFLRRRGIPGPSARQSADAALPPLPILRLAMPDEHFARFGLDGTTLLPRARKSMISYDGMPRA